MNKDILMNTNKSTCCDSSVRVIGGVTMFHVCLVCDQPCDVYRADKMLPVDVASDDEVWKAPFSDSPACKGDGSGWSNEGGRS